MLYTGVLLYIVRMLLYMLYTGMLSYMLYHGGVTIVHLVHGNVTKDKTCTVAILHFCCCW